MLLNCDKVIKMQPRFKYPISCAEEFWAISKCGNLRYLELQNVFKFRKKVVPHSATFSIQNKGSQKYDFELGALNKT